MKPSEQPVTRPLHQNSYPLTRPEQVGFWEAFRFWLKLGFISFGYPAGQIAIMHQELVEKRRWISEQRFLHAMNYCMLLPGAGSSTTCCVSWLVNAPQLGRYRCG